MIKTCNLQVSATLEGEECLETVSTAIMGDNQV